MQSRPENKNIVLKLATAIAMLWITGDLSAQSPTDELNQKLRNISQQMRSVGESLDENREDAGVVDRQKQIVSELNLLVRQFSAGERTDGQNPTQQQSPGATQSGQSPAAGEASADAREGDQEAVTPAELTDRQWILKAWGEMPGQLREERGSGISPKFLPKYERLIREYYLRMSR